MSKAKTFHRIQAASMAIPGIWLGLNLIPGVSILHGSAMVVATLSLLINAILEYL